jgi:hypothetical protein
MAKKFDALSESLQEFILKQKIFFVGTARSSGTVNVSPKGMDSLRVLGPNKVIWLNLTGSGNETAAHILENDRMTIMFCAFEGNPLILRLYGHAKVYHERDEIYHQYIEHFPSTPGARQVFELNIDMVQTSCGYAVPLLDYKEDRSMLKTWAQKKGKAKLKEYWQEKNTKSLDGFETGIFEE